MFLDLRHRLAVVVGDGAAAERKARGLIKYGGDVVVIGADPTMALIEAEAEGLLTLERRAFTAGDLAGATIVFCLVADEGARSAVLAEAQERGCLVSVPDAPEASNFSTPSTVRRGSLQIAVSTTGQAPEVARQVKSLLQEEFGEEWGEYVEITSRLRESLTLTHSPEQREAIMRAVVASDLLQRIRERRAPDVDALLEEFSDRSGDVS